MMIELLLVVNERTVGLTLAELIPVTDTKQFDVLSLPLRTVGRVRVTYPPWSLPVDETDGV